MSNKSSFTSSLKFLDISNMTKEEIIVIFDKVLASKENQVDQLSSELCTLNDKYNLLMSFNSQLEKEKQESSSKILKLEKHLKQELTDKEILLSKNSQLEKENKHLLNHIDNNINNAGLKSMNYSNNLNNSNIEAKISKKSETTMSGSKGNDNEEKKEYNDNKNKDNKKNKHDSILNELDRKILSVSMIDSIGGGNNNKSNYGKLASESIEYQPLFD